MRSRSATVPPLLVVMVAVLGLCAACDSGTAVLSDDRIDADRMAEVARDPDAAAADVVAAGRAVDAATVDSSVLVSFTADQGASEGRSAGAWRLYDAEGATIAESLAGVTEEGAATPSVIPVPDGYLVREVEGPTWHVATDGTKERVARAPRPRTTRSGDVLLDRGSRLVFRPADRTVAPTRPTIERDAQGWVLTDDGTLWQQRLGRAGRVPFERSTPRGTWQPAAPARSTAARIVTSLTLTAVGDRVAVAVTAEDSSDPSRASLVGLLVRRNDAPADRPWTLLRAPDVPGDEWWDTRTLAVDDTTVALSAAGGAPYLVDVTRRDGGGWPRLDLPTDEDDWDLEPAGPSGALVATHPDHADARISDDLGKSWTRLP